MSRDIEKALEYAKTSLAFEGMYLLPEEETLILKSLKGEITFSEFKKRVAEMGKCEDNK